MYMNSLAHAYDPHSDYMGHMQAENFAIQMKLSLFGIGAVLTSDEGYCKISELKEGPAQRSGKIKPDDRIVAVAQSNSEPVNVVGMPLDKVVEMIRGPKGTKVTLTLLPADAADATGPQSGFRSCGTKSSWKIPRPRRVFTRNSGWNRFECGSLA